MGMGHGERRWDWELGGRVKRMKVVEQLSMRYITTCRYCVLISTYNLLHSLQPCHFH